MRGRCLWVRQYGGLAVRSLSLTRAYNFGPQGLCNRTCCQRLPFCHTDLKVLMGEVGHARVEMVSERHHHCQSFKASIELVHYVEVFYLLPFSIRFADANIR